MLERQCSVGAKILHNEAPAPNPQSSSATSAIPAGRWRAREALEFRRVEQHLAVDAGHRQARGALPRGSPALRRRRAFPSLRSMVGWCCAKRIMLGRFVFSERKYRGSTAAVTSVPPSQSRHLAAPSPAFGSSAECSMCMVALSHTSTWRELRTPSGARNDHATCRPAR